MSQGANSPSPASQPQQSSAPLLTPSQIVAQVAAAAISGSANALKGTIQNVSNERSGQLSPSHTPGRR